VASDAVSSGISYPTFRRKTLPPSSGPNCKSKRESARSKQRKPHLKNLFQKCQSKCAQREATGASGKATSVGP
jgi:hypothetical protein